MRDLAFVGFLVALLGMGFRRPFLFVLAYAYVDIVSPQHLSYFLINSVPLSMIVAGLAIGGWVIADRKTGARFSVRQGLMLLLLGYAAFTTANADLPADAAEKWGWVWKLMVWSIFLPFALRTRLRIEAYLLFMVLCASSIIIVGGIKTALSGGGYGVLNLMVTSNSGLYESSTIATVAIAIIPLILWLSRFGTIFPRDWRVRLFAAALIFACLLIPVGTEARTGLVCVAVLAMLMLRDVKRRFVYAGLIALAAVAVIPFLPQSFSTRMETISEHREDASASTRLAVWAWTWDYAQKNPWGGGFLNYRQNQLQIRTVTTSEVGAVEVVGEQVMVDKARAYHSSYFEMLGEQGFPGLFLWLLIHGTCLFRMEMLRRRYRGEEGDRAWISPLATALQSAQIIYLVGSLFVGLAFQPFVWMLLSVQVAFDSWVTRRAREAKPHRPFRAAPAAVA